MDIKAAVKSKENFTLQNPMTIEELFDLMKANWTKQLPGSYKLKKGLFGKSIVFDVYLNVKPTVKVKGNVVKVQKVSGNSGVKVGGVSTSAVKNRKQISQAGGIKNATNASVEYYNDVCDGFRELLQGK